MLPSERIALLDDDGEGESIAFTLQAVLELAVSEMGPDAVRDLVEATIEAEGLELN